uniref:C2H2-type domain-containing protein n=1 Tax=Xiphophorus maculatus TaxID=8083 RepID=A0A3B5QXU9_XIPMA
MRRHNDALREPAFGRSLFCLPCVEGIQQQCSHSGMDQLSEVTAKVEQKPQKPGKYVCDYCGRACAKPSVLKKHIRSHTGERPYPCIPCGFSFKTKSNLYKHRKSHAHSVKAGTVPLSELGPYNANMEQGSVEGEGELFSDAEQIQQNGFRSNLIGN